MRPKEITRYLIHQKRFIKGSFALISLFCANFNKRILRLFILRRINSHSARIIRARYIGMALMTKYKIAIEYYIVPTAIKDTGSLK